MLEENLGGKYGKHESLYEVRERDSCGIYFLPVLRRGSNQKHMQKCGAALLDGAVYCGVCGAKIESESPIQSVQTESFVTPENENEEVVCTPVQAENIATQPVALTAEKRKRAAICQVASTKTNAAF